MEQSEKEEIIDLIEEKITEAINIRKKQVARQFKLWGSSITLIFSFLLIIGITTDDIIDSVRETILPRSHIISNLMIEDTESDLFKENIISELNDPALERYPNVKSTISANVWTTLETDDVELFKEFIRLSALDDVIIDNYRNRINRSLYSPTPDNMTETIDTIMELGRNPEPVIIGAFKNTNEAKTNCNLSFRQNLKRVILYFPPSTKINGNNALPYYQCPNSYPKITVSLTIEDISIDGILVVGVERPTMEDDIRGVRARVSTAVKDEFESKGLALGDTVSSGSIKVTDASGS